MWEALLVAYLYFMGAICYFCLSVGGREELSEAQRSGVIFCAVTWPLSMPIAIALGIMIDGPADD